MRPVYCDDLGVFAVRTVDPVTDGPLLHEWVTHPKARYWQMREATLSQVRETYGDIVAHPHRTAVLGFVDGLPCFLAERYDPARVELAGRYAALPGDIGMHFLCAPTQHPRHGFTRSVLSAVLTWLFEDPSVRRVVVEPDVRNLAVQAVNAAVGFRPAARIDLPDKQALLSFCTRDQFRPTTQTDKGHR
ncbi:acetyltransferase [Calidifontibacter sp. DB0510]|uniref:Lysine N-acyltransferase MbtK n=1 Tax=Metallococcus carri TaxID=1656884 RepID=A0A967B077_9MICO|nr:GNAT family N-acetyltransferase [Metallococcus carri]NHN55614.1 acetyltransferase [Metallococcus carri]NOP38202.1 acetyltransferase [Calidifontibacter sp. DB2511S]